jgi:hypothetical protein
VKTTVVPAQITTVEDRIAGNLTFTQIILLILPLITSTVTYAILPHAGKFYVVKIVLIVLQFAFFGSLALRIKGKVVMDWLMVYLRFAARPRIYVFTKNDLTHRNVEELPVEEKVVHKAKAKQTQEALPALTFPEHLKLSELLENKGLTIGFTQAEKGGINVSLSKQN